jgi:hypothetical protein
MALHEIREELTQQTILELDANGFGILQKKITLTAGQLHNIVQCDIYQDSILGSDVEPDSGPFIEFYVTPYPIIYTEMLLKEGINPLTNRGPSAANETILFKALTGPVSAEEFTSIEQFPNKQLGATPTFSFYTPTVYFTALVHGSAGALVSNISYSIYLALESTKASLVSYGLGVMRERSVAQGINLMNQGRVINPANNVGQVFPMWKYGGIRPERMLKGDGLRNFFLNYSSDESEAMLDTANIRLFLQGARTMQAFDAAFGADDAVKGPIPDWLRFDINRGLVSGPIRAQFPPRKFADNGNTLML